MPIITKEIKIMLLILFLAAIVVWLCLGPEAVKYLGGPVICPFIK